MAHSFSQLVISNWNGLVITKNNVSFGFFCFPLLTRKANAISRVSNQYSGWITRVYIVHSGYRNYFPAVPSGTLHDLGKKGLYKSLRQAVRLLFAQLAVSWYDLSLYSVLSVLKERCHLLGFLQKSCSGLYSGLHTDITGQNKYSLSLFCSLSLRADWCRFR